MVTDFLLISTFFFAAIAIYLSWNDGRRASRVNNQEDEIEKLNKNIRTEEAKLESLILSLPVGTILFTKNGEELQAFVVNQAARDYLRLGNEIGATEILNVFDKSIRLDEIIHEVFNTTHAAYIPETKIYDRDYKLFINPVFVPGMHDLVGVALIIHEITADKKLEKMRMDFTDMMIHELRAPTTAIRGAAALLLSNTLGPEEKEKMPRLILDSANDMLATVSDFLDMSRIDEGKFKLNVAKSDLVKIISDHVDVFSYPAREKNITINFDKDNVKIEPFMFDPVRIGQVINNLLSNSIKFTDQGGRIDIKIEQKGQNASDQAQGAQGPQILVEVDDNGIGIPETKKPLLFKKFGQINQRLGQGASSGLGLFISREIVNAHGGKIWLESEEGKGTKAYFKIPFITEEKAVTSSPNVAALSN